MPYYDEANLMTGAEMYIIDEMPFGYVTPNTSALRI